MLYIYLSILLSQETRNSSGSLTVCNFKTAVHWIPCKKEVLSQNCCISSWISFIDVCSVFSCSECWFHYFASLNEICCVSQQIFTFFFFLTWFKTWTFPVIPLELLPMGCNKKSFISPFFSKYLRMQQQIYFKMIWRTIWSYIYLIGIT